jgi:hypothetical protein
MKLHDRELVPSYRKEGTYVLMSIFRGDEWIE